MAWATPSTFTTGQVVTAANLNQIRDNLRYLKGLDGAVTIENAITSAYAAGSGGASTLTLRNTTAGASTAGLLHFEDSSATLRAQILGYANQDGFRLWGGGSGRMFFWGATGISNTSQTIIPAGVSRRWMVYGIAWNNLTGAGATVSGNNVAAGSANLLADGTHTLTVTGVTTPGALTISRTAGTATFDTVLMAWFL